MRYKTFIYSAVYFCLSHLFFCSDQTENNPGSKRPYRELTDTVVKDIPADKRTPSYQQMKTNVEKEIGIYSLDEGFDGTQIRLWFGYSFSDRMQLVILTNDYEKWTAAFYALNYQYNEKRDSITSIKKKISVKEPKSGWKNFAENLFSLDVLTLPDYHLLQDYYLSADADGITVEIATPNKYRLYSYPEPYYHKDKILQASKMVQIVELLEKEFDFEMLRKY